VTFRRTVVWDGRAIAVVGYPSHGLQRIKPFMVSGSLTGPSSPDGHRFQFHADVRHGNSGGPLFDGEGLVVGVVYAKLDTVVAYQATGQRIPDVGFAISNETTRGFLKNLGVDATIAETGVPRDEASLFADAQRSLARVVCWRP